MQRTRSGRFRIGVLALSLATAASLALASAAHGFVYWTNNGGSTIGRADLAGGSVNQSFVAAGTFPRQVTAGAAHLYWVANDGNTIGRAALDGDPASVDVDFVDPGVNLCGVAVDAAHVYWSGPDGNIGRANLDGTAIDLDFIATGSSPCELAVAGGFIYWADGTIADRIGRAALSNPGAPNNSFITGATDPFGVAVNSTHVYWTVLGGAIGRAAIAAPDSPDNSYITGANGPCGVTVDATHIYWANQASSGTPANSIGRAPLNDPGAADQDFITGANEPCGVAIGPPPEDPPAPPPSPANDFEFGKLKRNKQRGTAKLTVRVSGPGEVALAATRKLKADGGRAQAAGDVVLKVRPKGAAKRKLRDSGKARVVAEVTFSPDAGVPNTERKALVLKRD